MARRQLKLIKSELTNVNYRWLGAYRLRVDATEPSTGTDANVFLYQRNMPNPYNGDIIDVWLGVASPVDMAEYPIGEPNGETAYPFYRLSAVEVDFRATEIAKHAWTLIIEEVNNLLLALDRMDLLVPTEEVWVGNGIPGSDGSASSASTGG